MYSLGESLPFLLNRAGVAMGAAFTEELRQCDLTLPAWRILAALWSGGELSLGGLADVTSVELSTLSRQVAGLVERGLVVRRPSGIDWRSINLTLSPDGRVLVEQLMPSVLRHEQVALAGVSEADKRRLKQLLGLIYDNIVRLDEVKPTGATREKSKRRG
jgi:DNA-binding MarR family transcriptional regulator